MSKLFDRAADALYDLPRSDQRGSAGTKLPSTVGSPLQEQLAELKTIEDGWDGPDTRAPSRQVLQDVECVVRVIETMAHAAQVEVDAEGNVVLAWHAPDRRKRFELAFRGTGRVVGTLVSMQGDGIRAWRVDVDNVDELTRRLGHPSVVALIGEQT